LALYATPNPFNSVAKINVSLPNDSDLKLTVVDLSGREISTLSNGKLSAGLHDFVWKPDNCSSGIYFAIADIGIERTAQKLLLVK